MNKQFDDYYFNNYEDEIINEEHKNLLRDTLPYAVGRLNYSLMNLSENIVQIIKGFFKRNTLS